MSEQNGTEQVNGQVQGTQQAEVPQQQTQQVQQIVQQTEKQGFGGWLKKHWKGVTAGAAAILAGGGSAFVAYRKGKAAGIMSVPTPPTENEDYSLDPNR